MASPVKQKDGSWKVFLEDYEEDIPDLGREELICNSCGWSTYPECKSWCKAWIRHTAKQPTEYMKMRAEINFSALFYYFLLLLIKL